MLDWTLLTLLLVTGSGLESVPLPYETVVSEQTIDLDLRNVVVDVFFEAGAEPGLWVQAPSGDKPAELSLSSDSQVLKVRASGVDLQLRVDPAQQVKISGHDLDAVLQNESRGEGQNHRLVVRVQESQIQMRGTSGGDVETRGGSLSISDSAGKVVVKGRNTAIEVSGHRGEMSLEAKGGHLDVQDYGGKLDLDLEESDVTLVGGQVRVTAVAKGGFLAFHDWNGRVALDAQEASIRAGTLVLGHPELKIDGRGVETSIEGFSGRFEANLEGGSRLSGSGLNGQSIIAAKGDISVDIQSSEGLVKLHLKDGAEALVSELDSRLNAVLEDGRLQADSVFRITVQATRSEVVATGVRRQETFRAKDSEIDLDLTEAESLSALILEGQASARVSMSLPCLVRVNAAPQVLERQVQVVGCGIPGRGDTPRVRNAQTRMLIAQIQGEGRLDVTAQ